MVDLEYKRLMSKVVEIYDDTQEAMTFRKP